MLPQASKLLVGTWRDENSVQTYRADGTEECRWDNGETTKSHWSTDGRVITFRIFEYGGKRVKEYTAKTDLLSITPTTKVERDKTGTYHARRVK